MTQNTQPSLEEFDAWNDEAEAAAIEQIADHYKVRHIIKNGEYWALAANGSIYKLPLDLSVDDFKRLSDVDTNSESIDSFLTIITAFAGEDQAKELSTQPVNAVAYLLQDYAETLARIQGAELGK